MEITKYILCRVSSHFDFMCMDVQLLPPRRVHAANSETFVSHNWDLLGSPTVMIQYMRAKDATPKPMSRIGPTRKQNHPAPWAAAPLLRSPGLTQVIPPTH